MPSPRLVPEISPETKRDSSRSLPEYRRAYAHQRRSFGDRGLQVRRHAHRQRVEREALVAVESVAQPRELGEALALQPLVRRRLRHGHQAAQLEPAQRGHVPRERRQAPGRYAAFARFTRNVHLYAPLQIARFHGPRLRNTLAVFTADTHM